MKKISKILKFRLSRGTILVHWFARILGCEPLGGINTSIFEVLWVLKYLLRILRNVLILVRWHVINPKLRDNKILKVKDPYKTAH